jgi:ElaB/YqjD/DUF883 family membrane-anchored ribosome-binding protein
MIKEITKNYVHQPDLEEVKTITEILHYVGRDSQERKQIEIEQEARRTIDAMLDNYQKKLAEQDKVLQEQQKALQEKDKLIEELM